MEAMEEAIAEVDKALDLKDLERIPRKLYKFFEDPSNDSDEDAYDTSRQRVKIDIF